MISMALCSPHSRGHWRQPEVWRPTGSCEPCPFNRRASTLRTRAARSGMPAMSCSQHRSHLSNQQLQQQQQQRHQQLLQQTAPTKMLTWRSPTVKQTQRTRNFKMTHGTAVNTSFTEQITFRRPLTIARNACTSATRVRIPFELHVGVQLVPSRDKMPQSQCESLAPAGLPDPNHHSAAQMHFLNANQHVMPAHLQGSKTERDICNMRLPCVHVFSFCLTSTNAESAA